MPWRSPRFQASSGPAGSRIASSAISGANVRLKYCGPTEIGVPRASRISGDRVPAITVRVAGAADRGRNGAVPRGPATPRAPRAEWEIAPQRPQGDADEREPPAAKPPGPPPAGQARVAPPLDQGGDRQREHHRHADIARVEE